MENDYIEIHLIVKKVGTCTYSVDTLAKKDFNISAFLLFVHCTSVSAVSIKSLNFCLFYIFTCNLQGFQLVCGFLFLLDNLCFSCNLTPP